MARRKEPEWMAPFLAELRATGNVRWSAQQAGVDFSTAYSRRSRDAGFAEAWAAVLRARELAHAEGAVQADLPGRHGRPAPSQELIERVSARHGPQLVRAGAGRWSKRAGERFLTALAVTANINRAAAAAGFSDTTLYNRRLKDRHFAAAWEAAVAAGRARVDAYLVEAADRTFDPDSASFDSDLPKMTIAEAIKVMQLAKASGKAGGEPAALGRGWIGDPAWGTPENEAEVEQVRKGIIGKLERLSRREAAEKLAAGWTRDGEDWVPPGYSKVLDLKATPAAEDEPDEERAAGPRVRRL